MTEAPPGGARLEASLRGTIQTVGSVVAPTTLLTVLLFYFGWVSISTQANYFGFDYSLLGFSTRDYLLQSVSAVYLPLAAVLLLAAFLFWCHGLISEKVVSGPALDRLVGGCAISGFVLVAAGLLLASRGRPVDPFSPLAFAASVGILSYSVYLRRHHGRAPAPDQQNEARRAPSANTVVVALLLALTAFWEVAEYGEWEGTRKAQALASALPTRPEVVVYSPKRLFLRGAGVREQELAASEAYAFRYDGLRLLIRSNERFFLVPSAWSEVDRVTIVLRDSADLGLEFASR